MHQRMGKAGTWAVRTFGLAEWGEMQHAALPSSLFLSFISSAWVPLRLCSSGDLPFSWRVCAFRRHAVFSPRFSLPFFPTSTENTEGAGHPSVLTGSIDGHRKPVYSEVLIPRGLIGHLGMVQGCWALLLLHDEHSHPLWRSDSEL